MEGVVTKSTGSWYMVSTSDGKAYMCRIKGKLRTKGIRSTNPLAVGDSVTFDVAGDEIVDGYSTGVVKSVNERRNYIIRKSINLSKETHIIASNVDLALLLVTIKDPVTTTTFIDRFLASSEAYNIPVVIVFNKIDQYSPSEIDAVNELCGVYTSIKYKCLFTSTVTGQGLEELKSIMKDKVSVVSGHSGVGKSSLINSIDSRLNLKTGAISDSHKQGKHITTFSEMHRLAFGGVIIDTPGIRGFGLIDMQKDEIYHFFREIFETSHNCKFNNCTHTHEPGCAVVEAVKNGEIALSRYESYLNVISDDDDKYRVI